MSLGVSGFTGKLFTCSDSPGGELIKFKGTGGYSGSRKGWEAEGEVGDC